MVQFAFAFAVFLLLHMVPAIPGIRARLIAHIGRTAYLAAYSLVSLIVLGWLFHAALTAEFIPLWDPAPWQAWVTIVMAPTGLFLIFAGLMSVNPLSISMRWGDKAPGTIVAITRHPVLWGFIFWSGGHLVPNGDLRAVLLFGGFAIFAVLGMIMTERRARKRLGREWQARIAGSAIPPFAAIISRRASLSLDAAMVLSLLLTAGLTFWLLAGGHAELFGADPLTLARAGF